MKKASLILCLAIAAFFTLPQNVHSQSTTAQSTITKIADADDLFILSLTSDNWSGLPAAIEAKPFRSRGFSFLLMKEKANESGKLAFGYGLGFSSQNVHTDGALVYDDSSNTSSFYKLPDSLDVSLNKLSLNYIDAAIEFRLRTAEDSHERRFKVSLGFKAGVLVQSHTKYEDKNGKVKTYDIKNLNTFQYGPTFRIGYGGFALTGYYSLATVFKKSKGPEMNPYSVGIAVTF